jgi:thymidylate synthase (FAD)
MQIVKPSYQIYNDNDFTRPFVLVDGLVLLRKIEYMARISHGSEEAQTAISYDRFLRSVVLSKGDWSVVEHASLTVIFFVDRGITHELVRHRLASYTQSSTRFINYTKKIEPSFIYPNVMRMYSEDEEDEIGGKEAIYDDDWVKAIQQCEESYKKLVGKGWAPQLARSVFPNALGSRIAMTCNLRNWRHLLLMRSTREAHPQMRQVVDPLLEEMKNCIPILFEDIEAGATQAENLKKMR